MNLEEFRRALLSGDEIDWESVGDPSLSEAEQAAADALIANALGRGLPAGWEQRLTGRSTIIEFPRFERVLPAAAADAGRRRGDDVAHRATGVSIRRRDEGPRRVSILIDAPRGHEGSLLQVEVVTGDEGSSGRPHILYVLPLSSTAPEGRTRRARALLDDVGEWLETRVLLPALDPRALDSLETAVVDRSVVAALDYRSSTEAWRSIANSLPETSTAKSIIERLLRRDADPA